MVLLAGVGAEARPNRLPRQNSIHVKSGHLPFRPRWVSRLKKFALFRYKPQEGAAPRVHGELIFTGGSGRYFYAIKKKSGSKVWKFKTEGPVHGIPAFVRDLVLIGDDKGILYALGQEKGEERWRVSLGSELITEPTVHQETLYLMTLEGKVAALSPDGNILWEKEFPWTGKDLSILGNTAPRIDPERMRLYVGFADGRVRALNLKSGQTLWERFVSKDSRFKDVDAPLLLDGGRLYVAAFEGPLLALAGESGKVVWRQEIGSGVPLFPQGDRLYVSGSNGVLYALNKQDGSRQWTVRLGHAEALTRPIVHGNVLMVGLSESTIHFLRASDGKILAKRFAKKGILSEPIVDGNDLYYLSNGGRLYALQLIPL